MVFRKRRNGPGSMADCFPLGAFRLGKTCYVFNDMGTHSKQQLINEEMQFLLQQDSGRFKRQLTARLLEEGCNLPVRLARPLFYLFFMAELRGFLPEPARIELDGRMPPDLKPIAHPYFYEAILFFRSKLRHAEKKMTHASLSACESIVRKWRLERTFFNSGSKEFIRILRRYLDWFGMEKTNRFMGDEIVHLFQRRIYLAVTMSMSRHLIHPQDFFKEFGGLSGLIRSMYTDHQVFNRIFAYYRNDIPFFMDTASRVFWRTAQSFVQNHELMTEKRPVQGRISRNGHAFPGAPG